MTNNDISDLVNYLIEAGFYNGSLIIPCWYFSTSNLHRGSQRFTERDGYTGIPAEYYGPCTAYAAKNFTLYETDAALANGWINQQEYDDTVALRTETSPFARSSRISRTTHAERASFFRPFHLIHNSITLGGHRLEQQTETERSHTCNDTRSMQSGVNLSVAKNGWTRRIASRNGWRTTSIRSRTSKSKSRRRFGTWGTPSIVSLMTRNGYDVL